MNAKILAYEKKHLKKTVPQFKVGDEVKVHVRVQEGDKTRTQIFEGTVIRRRGTGLSETFTVLKEEREDQVERVFPLHAPVVEKVTVSRRGEARRAKLYHLRKKKVIELSSGM